MQTIQFSFPMVRETCMAALIDLLKALPSRSPLVGAHLLEGVRFEADPTRELELRGRPDEQIDGSGPEERADVEKFLHDEALEDLPVYYPPPGLADAYRVHAFPTLYVLDRKGLVRFAAQPCLVVVGLGRRQQCQPRSAQLLHRPRNTISSESTVIP